MTHLALRDTRIHGLPAIGVALSLLTTISGCRDDDADGTPIGGKPPEPVVETAQISLSVGKTPADVRCITVIIAGTRAERRSFDVTTAEPSLWTLGGLATGRTAFSAEAHREICADVKRASPTATWVGGPVEVILVRGHNGTVHIPMRPHTGVDVSIDFPTDPDPICLLAGTTCKASGDCCSQQCVKVPGAATPANANGSLGICRANTPGTGPEPPIDFDPTPLAEPGGHAAPPGHDGDYFHITYPRRPAGALDGRQIFNAFVMPALRSIRFENPARLISTEPTRKLFASGNYKNLAAQICDNAGDPRESPLREMQCKLLELGTERVAGEPTEPYYVSIEQGLGMTVGQLANEIHRQPETWIFQQRDIETKLPIEAKKVYAVRNPRESVTTVYGAVLNRYGIVNRQELSAAEAIRRGEQALFRIEGLSVDPEGEAPPEARLVLLPFGAVPSAPGRTALRRAYRTVLGGLARDPGPEGIPARHFIVWVDAENGDLLKTTALTNGALESRPAKRFVRDPHLGSLTSTNIVVTTPPSSDTAFSLTNDVFVRLQRPNAAGRMVSLKPSDADLAYADTTNVNDMCVDGKRRALGGFSFLTYAHEVIYSAGGLTLSTPRIQVNLDATETALYAEPRNRSLHFGSGVGIALPEIEAANTCTEPSKQRTPILDGTLVAHELAHLTIARLQADLDDDCAEGAICDGSDPAARSRFHDLADGYAALLTETPCIGGWHKDDVTCADPQEGGGLPRLLLAEPLKGFADATALPEDYAADQMARPVRDTFPTHRRNGAGDYGDGQIIGAAIWHTRQGLVSLAGIGGTVPLYRWLNEASARIGLSEPICESSGHSLFGVVDETACDADVYRPARELLLHLGQSWATSPASKSINKLLSGFARTGIFLTPLHCVDASSNDSESQTQGNYCVQSYDWGGDAIIDVEDNDDGPEDDVVINGVTQVENDFVDPCGAGPSFRIWSGPAFGFQPAANDGPVLTETVQCNDHYEVEVQVAGQWHSAATGPMPPGKCHVRVPISEAAWCAVRAVSAHGLDAPTAIPYRVTTWRVVDREKTDLRRSEAPGAGLWSHADVAEDAFLSRFFIHDRGNPDPTKLDKVCMTKASAVAGPRCGGGTGGSGGGGGEGGGTGAGGGGGSGGGSGSGGTGAAGGKPG